MYISTDAHKKKEMKKVRSVNIVEVFVSRRNALVPLCKYVPLFSYFSLIAGKTLYILITHLSYCFVF